MNVEFDEEKRRYVGIQPQVRNRKKWVQILLIVITATCLLFAVMLRLLDPEPSPQDIQSDVNKIYENWGRDTRI